jgi:hypothetical protein
MNSQRKDLAWRHRAKHSWPTEKRKRIAVFDDSGTIE